MIKIIKNWYNNLDDFDKFGIKVSIGIIILATVIMILCCVAIDGLMQGAETIKTEGLKSIVDGIWYLTVQK